MRITKKEYMKLFIGEPQKCLVEEKVIFDDIEYYTGHNERYVRLLFKAKGIDYEVINEMTEVVPAEVYMGDMLFCEIKTP